MHAYCIYGQSSHCKSMAETLEKIGAMRAFSPQVTQFRWKSGKQQSVVYRDLLPGYVFAFYEEKLKSFQSFYALDGFISKVGDKTMNYELCGQDLDFALCLYDQDGVMKTVHAHWEGNFVVLDDPLLKRCQAEVIQMEKRRRRAKIQFEFENVTFTTWIALEIDAIGKDEPVL
ncbi:MAG: hypothetical protein IJ153_11300 [Clostridia bacterium]|nr:hypothetical protein [Clostridia bacterium]MBQ9212272.1 hypothetical protein [Clostridia bacterium]